MSSHVREPGLRPPRQPGRRALAGRRRVMVRAGPGHAVLHEDRHAGH